MISESIFIQQKITTVFTTLANLNNWQKILPDILSIQVLYEDSYHQEFLLTVQFPLVVEKIRIISFCFPNSRLEMFQPKPPSGFKKVTDIWAFDEWEKGTRVSVERRFELITPSTTTNKEAEVKLRGSLSKDLSLIKASLEADEIKLYAK
ncbi:hypothetical protein PN456_20430 [Nodularia spumigena CS-586/05]|uniref:hypothetical protein n=1 Tax=Nodularia spumigena TaxID=70799 RepID=UPI00232EFD1B|nr:hypothetical protein [Nodularia spumigena]MDB9371276.1 hypothetical protein [Nodularia spumigena CS-586/05]